MQTVATADQGIAELIAAVRAFDARARQTGLIARKRRAHLQRQFEDALRDLLMRRARAKALPADELARTVDRLADRSLDPYAAAAAVIERMGL